jgi:hypothetical protein
MVSLVMAVMVLAVAPVWAADDKELSPDGGIGNTRQNFSREWGPLRTLTDPSILGQEQWAIYEMGNAMLFVTYQMEEDARPRPTDRVTLISYGFDNPISLSSAQGIANKYLPKDAKHERNQRSHYGYAQELYRSKAVEQTFPAVFHSEEEYKGEGYVWVTYEAYMDGDPRIGAVEIALFDDEK